MRKQKVTVPDGVQEFRIPALAELLSTSTAYWYKLIAQGKVTGRRALEASRPCRSSSSC
jgi:hypothetical protein